MTLAELVASEGTGQLSHTKLWSNIAYFICSVGFIWKVYQGTDTPELWLIYLGIIGSVGTASKVIAMKYGTQVAAPSGEAK